MPSRRGSFLAAGRDLPDARSPRFAGSAATIACRSTPSSATFARKRNHSSVCSTEAPRSSCVIGPSVSISRISSLVNASKLHHVRIARCRVERESLNECDAVQNIGCPAQRVSDSEISAPLWAMCPAEAECTACPRSSADPACPCSSRRQSSAPAEAIRSADDMVPAEIFHGLPQPSRSTPTRLVQRSFYFDWSTCATASRDFVADRA